jgi:hypothetical protein
MPDISKCTNESCPLKNTCYRYTCKPDQWGQVYTEFDFKVDAESFEYSVSCDYYMEQEEAQQSFKTKR